VQPITYDVDLSARRQHLVTVVMTVPADVAAGARIVVPTWTPGSYVERDYVHHLQARSATDATGDAVALAPDGHTAFLLPADVAGPVTVELEWYAHELTVRTNHVDDHHALLVPPATFPYVEGATDREHVVTITPTDDHTVWSLLPTDGTGPGRTTTARATDHLHLVDSAFEVGDFPTTEFEVDGVPHRWVHATHGGTIDLDRVAADVTAISAAARDVVGGPLPLSSYTFLCIGADEAAGAGGLEHRDGAVLMLPSLTDATDKGVRRTRSLIAHEYLHLWNVKRLVPAELTRFTLDRPQHTTSLWVAEGWTAYYDDLLPARAGLSSAREYLDVLRDDIVWTQRTPGTTRQSVADASWHAWTGLYVRDENSPNAGTNYYTHGAVLAAWLDLLLRSEAPDGDGLDTAFRLLWERFGHAEPTGYPDRGYTPDDVVAALSDAAGRDLAALVDEHVTGTALPPVEDVLATVGLQLEDSEPDVVRPHLGIQARDDDGGVVVSAALRDGPAWHGGVTGGDRIVAVDGLLVRAGELDRVLADAQAGDTVVLHVARGNRLLDLAVELGPPQPERRLVAVAEADDAQRRAFTRWTGHSLTDLDGSQAAS
jgi:predicted metalloprotease with PDZ domain